MKPLVKSTCVMILGGKLKTLHNKFLICTLVLGLTACGGESNEVAFKPEANELPAIPNDGPAGADNNDTPRQEDAQPADEGEAPQEGDTEQNNDTPAQGIVEQPAEQQPAEQQPAQGDTNPVVDVVSPEQPPVQEDPFEQISLERAARFAAGEAYYIDQCQVCHGEEGRGGPGAGPILDSVTNGSAISTTITTMPLLNPGECGQECAESVTWWVADVNNIDVSDTFAADEPEVEDRSNLLAANAAPNTKTENLSMLHKTSLNIMKRLPTASEIAEVESNGDAGLTTVFSTYVEGEAFMERIVEIYEPRFPSGLRNRQAYSDYVRQFGGDTDRHREIGDPVLSDYVNLSGLDSYSKEAVRLIEYVVRNNRPFTEILTADYTVMNYFGAWAYRREDSREWNPLPNPEFPAFPFDPNRYEAVTLPIPQAGIFTTAGFLDNYRTTETNRNRNRAYTVYLHYLDFDILGIPGSRISTDSGVAHEVPTMTDTTCTGCHTVMDPVASAFSRWQSETNVTYLEDANDWVFETIFPTGFNGVDRPDDARLSPLQWMANEIAQDRRFAVATVKYLIPAITGHRFQDGSVAGNGSDEAIFLDNENTLINELADDFIASGYDYKALAVAVGTSDFNADKPYLGGTASLVPVVRLNRKLETLLDTSWTDDTFGAFLTSDRIYGPVYQGKQPSGIITSVVDLMASEFACRAVARDLAKNNPVLLPNTDATAPPFDANGNVVPAVHAAIQMDIQNLYWVLWGLQVELSDERLIQDYQNYLLLYQNGRPQVGNSLSSDLRGECSAQGNAQDDSNYVIRSWIGIVNLMLSDFRFIYE